MSHSITIILRFEAQKAAQFETMFESEILPLWHEFKSAGKFIEASLSRVVDGDHLDPSIQQYVLNIRPMVDEAHNEFDTDPRFLTFLKRVQSFQSQEPLVRIAELVFKV